jgi:hypothetical protein
VGSLNSILKSRRNDKIDKEVEDFFAEYYRLVPTEEAHEILWDMWLDPDDMHLWQRRGRGQRWWLENIRTGGIRVVRRNDVMLLWRNDMVDLHPQYIYDRDPTTILRISDRGYDWVEALFYWLDPGDDDQLARELPPRV